MVKKPENMYTIQLRGRKSLQVKANSHFATDYAYCFSTLPPAELEKALYSGRPLDIVFEIDRGSVLYIDRGGRIVSKQSTAARRPSVSK